MGRTESCFGRLGLAFLAGFGLAVSSFSRPAGAQEAAAVIVDFVPRTHEGAGLPAGYVRNGQEYRPHYLEPLIAGDRVFARDAGARIEIQLLPSGRREVIDQTKPNYEIRVPSGVFAAFTERLNRAMRWINRPEPPIRPLNAIGRGHGLDIVPRVDGTLKLAPDPEPVWIGWRGGTPPFRVILEHGGMPIEVRVCTTAAPCLRETFLPPPATARRPLRLRVESETDGTAANRDIEIADPPLPVGSHRGATRALETMLDAVALSDQGDRAWILETARRVAPLAREFPPAQAILDGIKAGTLP